MHGYPTIYVGKGGVIKSFEYADLSRNNAPAPPKAPASELPVIPLPTATSRPALAPAPPAGSPASVKLLVPTTIQLRFGASTLAKGTSLPVVAIEGANVRVRVGQEVVAIPLANTDVLATTTTATIATATKDRPWENSLGMKFVPVPGTQVLFSIWNTRVADYAAYARVNKVYDSWTKQAKDGVPVSREPEHPVAGVNWDDANAFCKWLTEMESAAGKLPKGMKYRLPTDEEWSRAVGLPNETGTTPAEKSGNKAPADLREICRQRELECARHVTRTTPRPASRRR